MILTCSEKHASNPTTETYGMANPGDDQISINTGNGWFCLGKNGDYSPHDHIGIHSINVIFSKLTLYKVGTVVSLTQE